MLFSDIIVVDFATIFTGVHSSIDSQSNILYTCETKHITATRSRVHEQLVEKAHLFRHDHPGSASVGAKGHEGIACNLAKHAGMEWVYKISSSPARLQTLKFSLKTIEASGIAFRSHHNIRNPSFLLFYSMANLLDILARL